MKITIERYWDGDDDCDRYTYFTNIDGREHILAACALSGGLAESKIDERARELFGADVEIRWS